jgi:hypothetical protein
MEMKILRPGEKPRAKLDKLQTEFAQTTKELESLEHAPRSIEEARARLASALERSTERAAYAFESVLAPDERNVELPAQMTLGELAYLQGTEAFIDCVMQRIAGKAGMPAEQRTARLAALKEKLRALQVAEEQEVLDLERRDHTVLRRSDADVAILLEVWADYAPAQ